MNALASRAVFRLVATHGLTALALSGCFAASVSAAPAINNLSLRGLQAGGTTTLAIEGSDLLPDAQLVLDLPVAKQTVRPGATANRIEVDVTVDAAAVPGIYQLRVATPSGISNPLPLGVDALRQSAWLPEVKELPLAMTATLSGNQVLKTSFVGRKGQVVVAEVESRRIGSSLEPIVRLYDQRHVQLAYGRPNAALAGDCRLQFTLPAEGRYAIELHHVDYRAANYTPLRLKLGDFKFADLVLPLAVRAGSKTNLEFISTNLPEGISAEFDAGSLPGMRPATWPGAALLSGSRPAVIVSETPEVLQPTGEVTMDATKRPAEITAPVGLNGRLAKPGDEANFRLKLEPGAKLRFDVLAERAGSPLDGVLTLKDEKGRVLASNDDRPGTSDPGFDYTVAADVHAVVLHLKDLEGRGGPNFIFRIAVTKIDQPDFSLKLDDDPVQVPSGGTTLLRVEAARANYSGPIHLEFAGLPSGVSVGGAELPADATVALVSLSAAAATPAVQASLATITGVAVDHDSGPAAMRRVALLAANSATTTQPWLRSELGVAVAHREPLSLAWSGSTGSSAEPKLLIGGKSVLPLKITRADGVRGAVRLSLVSNQSAPAKAAKKPEPAGADASRLLRLEPPANVAFDKTEAIATILVPADLPARNYDFAVRGDLLAADQKTVVATAFTPIRSLPTVSMFHIELTGPDHIEARAGGGETGKFVGRIVRDASFKQPVRLTLDGVPRAIDIKPLEVAADKTEFEWPLRFPYNGTKLRDVENARLVAIAKLDPKVANSEIRSNEIPVSFSIVAGEKPDPAAEKIAAEKLQPGQPLAIFEDEQKFVDELDQGNGKAELDTKDKHSGKASVRVTPDQRFNPRLPGLNVKIREKPAEGEYRFITFAWKKKGGEQLCLQLAHDGTWGAIEGGKAPFRYHAGSEECFGGSLALQPKPPTEWEVVTRDLFADFGEFALTGLALSPIDGDYALFDHIYLGRSAADFDALKKK